MTNNAMGLQFFLNDHILANILTVIQSGPKAMVQYLESNNLQNNMTAMLLTNTGIDI